MNRQTGEFSVAHYQFERTTLELLLEVVDFYSRVPAGALVELTHAAGGPWDRAWNHSGLVNPGMRIDENAILDFYSGARCPFSIQ